MSDVELDQSESDPIKHSYDIYIKPQLSAEHQLYILQFPNRNPDQRYSESNVTQPSKFRVKPKAGMVEMDVPINATTNYDREKGAKWGDAIKRSNMVKGGGSHGLPGGFGIGGAQQPAGRGRGRGEDDMINPERIMADYSGAIAREQVLVKQTLGGQTIPITNTTPIYFIGAFKENRLHLTPVDNIVQMRPQFHHIDAQSEQEKLGRPRDPAAMSRPTEARAIHMTVKSTIDGEEDTTENMSVRISAAQQEEWQKHRYVDEDTDDAWDKYDANLFVKPPLPQDAEERPVLTPQTVPNLVSGLDNMAYMDSISAPRDAAKLSRSKKVTKMVKTEDGEGGEEVTIDLSDDE